MRKKTKIYRSGRQYSLYPSQFNTSDKIIFDLFESIANEKDSAFHSFVVFNDSIRNGVVKMFHCNVDGLGFALGGMTFNFDIFIDAKGKDIITSQIHECACHAILNHG